MNMTRLMPDFLTAYTDGVWKRTRQTAEDSKSIMPTLLYLRDGAEFGIPMTYDAFVHVGKKMERTRDAARALSAMGPEFGFLAMQIAERASNLLYSAHDKDHFLCEVGSILHLIRPQAFFLSVPVKLAAGVFTPDQVAALVKKGPDDPGLSNAVMVTGRNLVRSYSVVTPFVSDPQGNIYYEKSIVLDSLSGIPHQAQGPFASIYEPARN